ncbi:unnamed protein product [Chrysoparadoxa australica]
MSLLMEVKDGVGSLHEVLRYFWKYDISITRIESRPLPRDASSFDFSIDFYGQRGERHVDDLLQVLKGHTKSMHITDHKDVPWFPRHVSDVDAIIDNTLQAGADLEADHPGFSDSEYRRRRDELAQVASDYSYGQSIPRIPYSPKELKTWAVVWDKMAPLQEAFACSEYKAIMQDLASAVGYCREAIPQQEDISQYLQTRTGFKLRPVAGLLSSRDFLNGLAFRVFFCTQYIRHHGNPTYTPEPDIIHELLGHAPMFASQDFADFSQEIGLASLGATDEEIIRLARCYWFSVEFGICTQDGGLKAYGAGLLSSVGELEYACAPYRPAGGREEKPEYISWDPNVAAETEFPITCFQPKYFVSPSLNLVKQRMRSYCDELPKSFRARYNPLSESIWVDRAIQVRGSKS